MTKLLIFDYDNTLATPMSIPTNDILYEITRLLAKNYIAVMSGRTLKQLNHLFIKNIPTSNIDILKNLFICPSYGNLIYNSNIDKHNLMYKAEKMTEKDVNFIYNTIEMLDGIEERVIKEREGYIVMDCLGNSVSNEKRKIWDPDGTKRLEIVNRLDTVFKGRFNLFIAGRATIDIVAKGRSKADNTVRLARMLDIPLKNVIFTGDEFYKYGNDYPILSLKEIQVNIVKNPKETLRVMKKM
ncbi:MAG: HAD-IIB family hydrolase [Candidatus Dojkabacteria bacterium]|jgi:HAD superfamily hydrolase (TIGR01484 family)